MVHTYYYDGTELLLEKWGNCYLRFTYDEQGRPFSVDYYNGTTVTTYYYWLNLQGDVIEIRNSANYVVCRYFYDAWGKILSIKDDVGNAITAAGHIGNLNPLRYRGYYYDNETGLYYLRSRYYDPVVGRFISPDAYISTGQGLVGYNRFAYCNNNPIVMSDESGDVPAWLTALVGIVAAAEPTPVGEIVFAVLFASTASVLLTPKDIPVGDISWGVSDFLASSKTKEKTETTTNAAVIEPENPKKPVLFPSNPHNFSPKGLIKVVRSGSKNGKIISWMFPSGKVEVFRWDENINYSNGPHYHVYGNDNHYYAGDLVPEPLASIHFG